MTLRWILPVLAVLQVLAGALHPLTGLGRSIAERSAALTTPITPVGSTFAIWGLIYLGCLLASLWMASPAQHRSGRWSELQRPFAWAMVSNAAWPLWVQLVNIDGCSVALIIGTLWMLLRALSCWHARDERGAADWLFVGVPLSLFAGWVTIATFVNLACTATLLGLMGTVNPALFGCALLLACAALAVSFHARCGANPVYLGAIIWGLRGIWQRPEVTAASWLSLALAVLLGVVAVSSLWREKRRPVSMPL